MLAVFAVADKLVGVEPDAVVSWFECLARPEMEWTVIVVVIVVLS
jgi:hypothetical protein